MYAGERLDQQQTAGQATDERKHVLVFDRLTAM